MQVAVAPTKDILETVKFLDSLVKGATGSLMCP